MQVRYFDDQGKPMLLQLGVNPGKLGLPENTMRKYAPFIAGIFHELGLDPEGQPFRLSSPSKHGAHSEDDRGAEITVLQNRIVARILPPRCDFGSRFQFQLPGVPLRDLNKVRTAAAKVNEKLITGIKPVLPPAAPPAAPAFGPATASDIARLGIPVQAVDGTEDLSLPDWARVISNALMSGVTDDAGFVPMQEAYRQTNESLPMTWETFTGYVRILCDQGAVVEQCCAGESYLVLLSVEPLPFLQESLMRVARAIGQLAGQEWTTLDFKAIAEQTRIKPASVHAAVSELKKKRIVEHQPGSPRQPGKHRLLVPKVVVYPNQRKMTGGITYDLLPEASPAGQIANASVQPILASTVTVATAETAPTIEQGDGLAGRLDQIIDRMGLRPYEQILERVAAAQFELEESQRREVEQQDVVNRLRNELQIAEAALAAAQDASRNAAEECERLSDDSRRMEPDKGQWLTYTELKALRCELGTK